MRGYLSRRVRKVGPRSHLSYFGVVFPSVNGSDVPGTETPKTSIIVVKLHFAERLGFGVY